MPNGFQFYHNTFHPQTRAKAVTFGNATYPERQFELARLMVGDLKNLGKYLVSGKAAPNTTVSSDQIRARAFLNGDGKVALLVVNTVDQPVSGVIELPGRNGLKSRYGFCRELGGGRYEFATSGLVGDILYE